MTRPVLVIDAHGGDFGPTMTIPATIAIANQYPSFYFDVILGSQASSEVGQTPDNIRLIINDNVIDPNTSPTYVLKHKRQSTLGQALSRLSEKKAVGCLTAANTGALVALSRHFLSRFQSVKKPALTKPMPGGSYLLDLGANIDCTVDDLLQFAYLGSAFYRATHGQLSPGVALLNVGSENHKGTKVIRAAHERLSQSQSLHYDGFIEANNLFNNRSQVIVCDGLVGNIALKTSEGLSHYLQAEISRQLTNLEGNSTAVSALSQQVKQQMNPAQYNGACLLGLNGLVVKSHGGANQQGFTSALKYLVEQVAQDTLSKFQHYWSVSPFSFSQKQ